MLLMRGDPITQGRLRGQQTFITHVYMLIGARHMLELAEASPSGQLYTATASLLYSAFTLEAYFNHLGKTVISEWEQTERKMSKMDKFRRLASKSGLSMTENKRPQRTMMELFNFRDSIAHGRDVHENVDQDIEWSGPALPHFMVESDLMRFATPQRARDTIRDVEKLVRQLHHGCKQQGDPFTSGGTGLFGVEVHPEDGPPPSST